MLNIIAFVYSIIVGIIFYLFFTLDSVYPTPLWYRLGIGVGCIGVAFITFKHLT